MGETTTALSIIIPVYNGAALIGGTLEALKRALGKFERGYEILVVNDGSTDGTSQAARAYADSTVRLIELPVNRGKFGALKEGMRAAAGSCCIFTDADLPYETEALFYIEELVNGRGLQIVTGDRSLASSKYHGELSAVRRFATAAFSYAVRMLVTGGLFDTQCGLKGFRREIAKPLFTLIEEEGFAGDVELLYIALKYNLEIKRIPVRLQRQGPSSVAVFRDALKMLSRIAKLKYNWAQGKYYSAELAALAKQEYWSAYRA